MLLLCTYQKLVNLLHNLNLASDIFAHMNTYGAKMHFIEMARIGASLVHMTKHLYDVRLHDLVYMTSIYMT